MRFQGRADFVRQDGAVLHFHESGALTFGDHRGEASQRYRFQPCGPAADVLFEDGRLFHRLDLSTGNARVSHPCAPDLYEGRYRVFGPHAWTVSWRITGPRKRQVIASLFQRMGVAGTGAPSHNGACDQGETEWAAGRVQSIGRPRSSMTAASKAG